MPRGDRTGPWGAGPMTGRGAGWCAGHDRSGFVGAAHRFGPGLGYRGGGGGWRNMYYATGLPGWARPGFVPPPATEQELAELKAQADWLAGQLEVIQKRIKDIEGQDSAETE